MTIADEARDNSISCEMVKYAYRQTKDGVVVSFVVHPNDIPAALSTSHIGSRYMVVLVQIGDDEKPIPLKPAKEPRNKPAAKLQPDTPDKPRSAGVGRDKRDWNELQPAQQAGIRSGDPNFALFLEDEYPQIWREHQDAAECIRSICEVHSRAELGTNQRKRVLWNQLDKHYQAYDARIRLNA